MELVLISKLSKYLAREIYTLCAPDKETARAVRHVTRGSPSLPVFVRVRAYLSVPAQACRVPEHRATTATLVEKKSPRVGRGRASPGM